jgi:hypothetical protein
MGYSQQLREELNKFFEDGTRAVGVGSPQQFASKPLPAYFDYEDSDEDIPYSSVGSKGATRTVPAVPATPGNGNKIVDAPGVPVPLPLKYKNNEPKMKETPKAATSGSGKGKLYNILSILHPLQRTYSIPSRLFLVSYFNK